MTQAKTGRGPKKGEPKNWGNPVSISEFRRLWYDMGVPLQAIADRLGVTTRTASQRAKALGFDSRTKLRGRDRDHFDAEFPALWVFGVGVHELARHYGVTTAAVYMKAHRAGMSARGRGVSRFTKARTIADFRAVQLAAAMARSAATESRAVKEYWAAA